MREFLEKRGIQGFLVTNLTNVRYLSGFTGSSGFILIGRKRNILVTDFRYREQVEWETAGSEKGKRSLQRPEWDIFTEKGNRLKIIRGFVAELGIRTLAFESTASYEFFKALSGCGAVLKPLSGIVERLRAVKDREETRLIKEAIRRAEEAFLAVKPNIRSGRRERQIALMLEQELKKKGSTHLPFDIIVASGANAAMPHARSTDKKLSPGDLVVIDWGGEAGGYYSDMTRTFLMGGVSGHRGAGGVDLERKKEMYRLVLKASRDAISSVRPGAENKAVDNAVRHVIKNAGLGEFFGHGTGHGVGLEVHELPRISWVKSETLRENMIFTIEPGIYIPGLGGVRIEDMVRVKTGGKEVLTGLPRALEVIGD